MIKCNLCGNKCNINREKVTGVCNVPSLKIAKYSLHHFEEPVISGTRGSGTIFFCGCSLACVFCQNFEVSRNTVGKNISIQTLVDIMKELEDGDAHNINFVNPTHFANEILEALSIYKPKIPTIWNSHGYDSLQTIKDTKGLIDIYLPDLKYVDSNISKKYSGVENYFDIAKDSILEMRKNVVDLIDDGIMQQGLIVRHLILPKQYHDSLAVLSFIKENLPTTTVSIMSQYTPFGDLTNYPEINRKIFSGELARVQKFAVDNNLMGFSQSRSSSSEEYIPQWDY